MDDIKSLNKFYLEIFFKAQMLRQLYFEVP